MGRRRGRQSARSWEGVCSRRPDVWGLPPDGDLLASKGGSARSYLQPLSSPSNLEMKWLAKRKSLSMPLVLGDFYPHPTPALMPTCDFIAAPAPQKAKRTRS